jgi:hypothetical protein
MTFIIPGGDIQNVLPIMATDHLTSCIAPTSSFLPKNHR